jgi:ubiquinone/menaquinone biosynthesis C-methylase UbiE
MFSLKAEDTNRKNQQKLISIAEQNTGCKFLDCGCGDGSFSLEFAKKVAAKEIWGVELSESANLAIKKMNIKIFDLNNGLPFDSGSFDVILCNQVAEHIVNTDLLFKEIARVLKSGGKAYISVPNICSFHNRIFVSLGFQPTCIWPSTSRIFGNPFNKAKLYHSILAKHVTCFSPGAFREMVEFHGLKVVKYCGHGVYPFRGKISAILSNIFPELSVFQTVIVTKD